jgi:hypothetical protein
MKAVPKFLQVGNLGVEPVSGPRGSCAVNATPLHAYGRFITQ